MRQVAGRLRRASGRSVRPTQPRRSRWVSRFRPPSVAGSVRSATQSRRRSVRSDVQAPRSAGSAVSAVMPEQSRWRSRRSEPSERGSVVMPVFSRRSSDSSTDSWPTVSGSAGSTGLPRRFSWRSRCSWPRLVGNCVSSRLLASVRVCSRCRAPSSTGTMRRSEPCSTRRSSCGSCDTAVGNARSGESRMTSSRSCWSWPILPGIAVRRRLREKCSEHRLGGNPPEAGHSKTSQSCTVSTSTCSALHSALGRRITGMLSSTRCRLFCCMASSMRVAASASPCSVGRLASGSSGPL